MAADSFYVCFDDEGDDPAVQRQMIEVKELVAWMVCKGG